MYLQWWLFIATYENECIRRRFTHSTVQNHLTSLLSNSTLMCSKCQGLNHKPLELLATALPNELLFYHIIGFIRLNLKIIFVSPSKIALSATH
jgi:hypothetical protein